MDLPDCPPGTEGYDDTVTVVPKKPDAEDSNCTKAELEFKEYLNSLKIKVEDGSTRCMVDRRGRDVAGKYIYLCFPCAAVCSGESILQTHISGKKHKSRLCLKNVWPLSIFEEHPYVKSEKGENVTPAGDNENILQKMSDAVNIHNMKSSDHDDKYGKFRNVRCLIQDKLDSLKAPLLGLEYLIEFLPEEAHHEPSYYCLLCSKQGAPRTIINHMVSFWHRIHYLWRHYQEAHNILQPYRNNSKYREGVSVILSRLIHRIEETHGRLKPMQIDKDLYNKEKDQIAQWVFKGRHISEKEGPSFTELVDVDLIMNMEKQTMQDNIVEKKKDPSPPVVAAPSRGTSKPSYRRNHHPSLEDLSDDFNEERDRRRISPRRERDHKFGGFKDRPPYHSNRRPQRSRSRSRERFIIQSARTVPKKEGRYDLKQKTPNYEYKLTLTEDQVRNAKAQAAKLLAYHEKNPEKHPLYPEEWKKFWNKRYKELQNEGKDPSKHDFKPEWIIFWTKRMKELHDEDLGRDIEEIYRRMNVIPPEKRKRSRSRSPRKREWSPRNRSRSPRKRSRSPPPHVRRARSPPIRRSRSPPPKRNRTPISLHRSRSPQSSGRNASVGRSSQFHKAQSNPYEWHRDDRKKSLSPLSLREAGMRNSAAVPAPLKTNPVKDAVMISDDELKDDPHSPWNSPASIESLGSLPDAKSPAPSHASSSRAKFARDPKVVPDSPDDIVSSLRLLVALEDYMGSLGPKLVDMLTLALKMEKEKPNSSEQLLDNELSVSLIETAKEKLKGAVQAGLVAGGAAGAARKAITKAAALLHEADKRQREKQIEASKTEGVAVAGVGAVDKAAIAKQMAAALIAQGKTDVTTEELAQLVDAVVGMAEAKKREAEKAAAVAKLPSPETHKAPALFPSASNSGNKESGSGLQLLQSAYEEKKMEETPDVMDGLSDSDLKTLLQNFSELSAEEQHGLIAYLKKLEAKDHHRVERLREYVSAAVNAQPEPPKPSPPPKPVAYPAPAPAPAPAVKVAPAVTLTVDSDDDDDYTVEEVFKSAAEKVKENQIRQEMEMVKKLLSHDSKEQDSDVVEVPLEKKPHEQSRSQTSAANVLALIQASVQSSSKQIDNMTDVKSAILSVQQSVQPKLFGDKPGAAKQSPNVANLLASLMGNQISATKPVENIPTIDAAPVETPRQNNWNNFASTQPFGNQASAPQTFGQNQQPYNPPPTDVTNQNYRDEDFRIRGPINKNINNQGPMGGNSMLMRGNTMPMGDTQMPLEDNQMPMGGNQMHMGGNQNPMGVNQMPLGGNQMPMGSNQMPMGGNQMRMGVNQMSMGGNQMPMGGNQMPMGGNQMPMGGNQMPMGGNQMPRGGNQLPRGGNNVPMGGQITDYTQNQDQTQMNNQNYNQGQKAAQYSNKDYAPSNTNTGYNDQQSESYNDNTLMGNNEDDYKNMNSYSEDVYSNDNYDDGFNNYNDGGDNNFSDNNYKVEGGNSYNDMGGSNFDGGSNNYNHGRAKNYNDSYQQDSYNSNPGPYNEKNFGRGNFRGNANRRGNRGRGVRGGRGRGNPFMARGRNK